MYQKSPTITIAQTKKTDIVIDFNGGMLTSDAGTLLLQQIEQKIQLIKQINSLINDPRDPLLTTHQQHDLLAQRIFAIALGYEDVNDHIDLRNDPALLVGIKGNPNQESPLGSAPTLSRLENRITDKEVREIIPYSLPSFCRPPLGTYYDSTMVHSTYLILMNKTTLVANGCPKNQPYYLIRIRE